MPAEVFKAHPVHAGVWVSDCGSVETCRNRGGHDRPAPHRRPLKAYRDRKGYLYVELFAGGRRRKFSVHRLVLETFVGPCPPGMEARHVGTNDPWDNRLDNLCWGTRSENQADRKRHGTYHTGSQMPWAKLTEADVVEMRQLRRDGIGRDDIARRFGVAPTHVSKVLLGKMWQHVTLSPEERESLKRATNRGERNPLAKLTTDDVARIRERLAVGEPGAAIGRAFGVSKTTISKIRRGRAWVA
jgi:transcriptional regulator with XRE-family HTH domain